jgi:hypothetical protein
MGRFARSWALVRLCWQVLRQDKELTVFPLVSTIAVLVVTASFVIPGFFTGFWQSVVENGAGVGLYVLIVLSYLSLLGATLRGIYSAALYEYAVGGATGAFDHETLAGAFRPKRSRRGI